jgi:hypothetical protein
LIKIALDQEVTRILEDAWSTGKIVKIASRRNGGRPNYVAKQLGITPSQLNWYFMNVLAHGNYREWYVNEIKARREVAKDTYLIPDRRKRSGRRNAPIFEKYGFVHRDSQQRLPQPSEDD